MQVTLHQRPVTSTVYVAANDSSNNDQQLATTTYTCSGVDDDVVINNAISSLTNGGTVCLLPGNYYLDAPNQTYSTIYHAITLASNIRLTSLPGAKLQWKAGGPDESSIMILGQNLTHTTIDNLHIDAGSYTTNYSVTQVYGNLLDVNILYNWVENSYQFGIFSDPNDSSYGRYIGNTVTENNGIGIGVHNGPKTCIVSDNIVKSSVAGSKGYMLDSCTNVTMTGNTADVAGIALYIYDGVLNSSITGNHLKGTSNSVYFDYSSGKDGCDYNILTGNQLRGAVYLKTNSGMGNMFIGNYINGAVTDDATSTVWRSNTGKADSA